LLPPLRRDHKGFSQWFKKEFGIYPPREMLVELGRMSKAESKERELFGVYLWERKKEKEHRGFVRRSRGKGEGDA
jgi:hypothetical protein